MTKRAIARTVINDMGYTYDAQIIIDALTQKEAYLFDAGQVKAFKEYAERFGIEKTVNRVDYYWEVA